MQARLRKKPTARWVHSRLTSAYPQARCALAFETPFQLLVATILSAQCTDRQVNLATPALFRQFGRAELLATAPLAAVEALVRSTGFYRNKARNIVATAGALVAQHGGEVPRSMAALVQLPGVARKTANVVLGVGYGQADGVVVDTHVGRLARRLGLSRSDDPIAVEADLMKVLPRSGWIGMSLRLIEHGRAVCVARSPRCAACLLASRCPSAVAAAPARAVAVAAPAGPRQPERAAGRRKARAKAKAKVGAETKA